MAAIRSRDTGPELALRRALRARGLRGYRCNLKTLPGKPDIAFTRWKLAIFVDGAFWHGHPDHFRPGALSQYWDTKIKRTQERDQIQKTALEAAGYKVLRFWDFEIKDDLESCLGSIVEELGGLGCKQTSQA
jgi:DNA mismatch endonuclease, patch repair protein